MTGLKYPVGLRVVDFEGEHGFIESWQASPPIRPYLVRLDSGKAYRYYETEIRPEAEPKPMTEQDIRNDERNKTIKDVCRAVHATFKPVLQDLDVIGPEDTSTLTMCRMMIDEYHHLEVAMQNLRDADNEEIAALNREIRRLKGDDEIPF